jgi:hypothetical protein
MPARSDAFDTRRIRRNAADLRLLESLPVGDLPWPRNLYSTNFMAKLLQQRQRAHPRDLCICGKEHHKLYPRTTRSEYGRGFNVTYYCSDSCKGSAAEAEAGRVNGG